MPLLKDLNIDNHENFIKYKIPCKNEYFISYLDSDDFNKYKNYNISKSDTGYVRISIKGKKYKLHRLIMDCPDNKIIDHLNGNKLDNRKINLRICSYKENARNQNYITKYSNILMTKSGFYKAYICVNNKQINLGTYKILLDAQIAVNNYKYMLGYLKSGQSYHLSKPPKKNLKYSPFRGTSWCKKSKKWRSYIKYNGKQIYGGLFVTRSEASNQSLLLRIKYGIK